MKGKLIRFTKISWKLTFTYSLIFSLVLIFLNIAILYGTKYFLIQQAMDQVEASSFSSMKMIVSNQNYMMDLQNPELLDEAQANPDIIINIADAQGQIVNSAGYFRANRIDITKDLDMTKKAENNENHYVVRNNSVRVNGEIVAYLQVIRSTDKEYDFIKLLFVFMAIADFTGIIVSILAGYIVSRKTLRPIDRISKAAQNISVSDLSSRIEVSDSDDELARLAITFNDMIARLKASFEKQNQFVSDASHELRTPVAVIQGYINLIDRWGKEDKKVLQESIEAIKNETTNMTDLIERLLFLARSDNEKLRLQKEKVGLYELAEEVIKESKLIAPRLNIALSSDSKPVLLADKKLLKQLLRALVDNSIKYTSADGAIEICTEVKDNEAEIIVRDTGIGIPENELQNIFSRFYRIDKARTKENGGSGLGLSIVKQIVDAHNGSIYIDSKLGEGTKVIISLPLD